VQAHKQLASVGKFPRDHPRFIKNDTSFLPGIVVHSLNMTSWCWTDDILQGIQALRPMVTISGEPSKKVAGWVIGVATGGAPALLRRVLSRLPCLAGGGDPARLTGIERRTGSRAAANVCWGTDTCINTFNRRHPGAALCLGESVDAHSRAAADVDACYLQSLHFHAPAI
jgi:hypothetical protein